MQYKELCGERVSALGYGTMRLPKREDGTIDRPAAFELIDRACAGGVNYYDTAWCYHDGDSEVFVGEALEKYPRESYFVADKMPVWVLQEEADLERIFAEQLKRCRVESFDFYLAHSIDDDNYKPYAKYGVYSFLAKKKREGFIKHLGFSFHGDAELMRVMLRDREWDFVQLELNWLDWVEQDAKTVYGLVVEKGLPVIVMEPLRGGLLMNPPAGAADILREGDGEMPLSDWSFRWLSGLDGVKVVLSGMTAMEHLEDNLRAFQSPCPLDDAHLDAIDRAVAAIRSVERVPCTACGYCMPCPFGVDIPGMLKIYNKFLEDRYTFPFKKAYYDAPAEARAENCTACGACKSACPQGIAAYEHMARIAELAKNI